MKKYKNIINTIFLIIIFAIVINYNVAFGTDVNNEITNLVDKNTNSEIINDSDNKQDTEETEEDVYNGIKGEQSAEDGTYVIMNTLNKRKFFDIGGGSIENGVKVQIWDSAKVSQQKFDIEYIGDGFYKIKSKKSGKVLTIESEEPQIGSHITQQEDKELDTQKWILKKYSESVYAIISKCENLYLEVPSTTVSNGQKIQLNKETNSDQQKFVLVNQTPTNDIGEIDDGIYQLELSTKKVVDIGAGRQTNNTNAQIWENTKVQQQKFHITRVGKTNYYKIVAVHSAKVLDANGGKETPGTNVSQYQFNSTNSQYWYFKSAGNGYYNIISKVNGLYLDISGGKSGTNGANVQLWYGNNTSAQKFKLTAINIINNNIYEIETKLDTSKVLDVGAGSTKDGTNIQLWAANNVPQQRFSFTALTTDTYKILAKHSNKALTVNTSNNNVYQATYTGGKNQQWQIIEDGNLYYHLVSKANNMVIDISGGKNNNGQNVQVYKPNGTRAQSFRFVTGFRKFYSEGTYGKSGLGVKGDKRGTTLKYYKIGKGSKAFFAAFSIHGWEDSYAHDGKELTYIAEEFKNYLKNSITEDIVNNYTIYIFPCLNPDGQVYGTTNDGPGRTTLYSAASGHKGIDMNRCWSVGFTKQTNSRNYTGTTAFQAYEARYLRDFILNHQGTTNILVDTHGWLNETMGDNALGKYYRDQFDLPKQIDSYGRGYLINWARTLKKGRSTLVELPEVTSHTQVVDRNYAKKWINATMKILKEN